MIYKLLQSQHTSTSPYSNEPSTYQICYRLSGGGTCILEFEYIKAHCDFEAQQIAEGRISFPYEIVYVRSLS